MKVGRLQTRLTKIASTLAVFLVLFSPTFVDAQDNTGSTTTTDATCTFDSGSDPLPPGLVGFTPPGNFHGNDCDQVLRAYNQLHLHESSTQGSGQNGGSVVIYPYSGNRDVLKTLSPLDFRDAKRAAGAGGSNSLVVALNATGKISPNLPLDQPLPLSVITAIDTIAHQMEITAGDVVQDAPAAAGAAIQNAVADAGLAIIARASELIFKLSYAVLQLTGQLFGLSLKYLIFEMGRWVDGIPALYTAWTLFRDAANLSFIFILLYAAITTILGKSSTPWQKTLGNLVMVAVLINFSMFFVQVVVDASNYVTFQIYNNITVEAPNDEGVIAPVESERLTTAIFNTAKAIQVQVANNTSSQLAGATGSSVPTNPISVSVTNILSAIMLFVLAFVLGSAAIMFIYRALWLIGAMVTSALQFARLVTPKGEGEFRKWAMNVVYNSAWIVVYMFGLYVMLQIFADQNFAAGLGATCENTAGSGAECAASYFNLLLNYILVTGGLIGTLFAAKEVSKKGADGASAQIEKWTGKFAKGTSRFGAATALGGGAYLARNTVGRESAKQLKEKRTVLMQQRARGGIKGRLAGAQLAALEKGSKASFDARNVGIGKKFTKDWIGDKGGGEGGFAKKVEEKEKKDKETGKEIGKMSKQEKKEHKKKLEDHKNKVADLAESRDKEIARNTAQEKAQVGILRGEIRDIEKAAKKAGVLSASDISKIQDKSEKIKGLQKTIGDKTDAQNERYQKGFDDLEKEKPKSAGEERVDAYKKRVNKKLFDGQVRDFAAGLYGIRHLGHKVEAKIEENEKLQGQYEAIIERLLKDNEEQLKTKGRNWEAIIDRNNSMAEGYRKKVNKLHDKSVWLERAHPQAVGNTSSEHAQTFKEEARRQKDAKSKRDDIQFRQLKVAREKLAATTDAARRAEIDAEIVRMEDAVKALENDIRQSQARTRKLRVEDRKARRTNGTWVGQARAAAASEGGKDVDKNGDVRGIEAEIDRLARKPKEPKK